MSDVLSHYQRESQKSRETAPWIMQMQQRAESWLLQRGFPTRKEEDWKYSKLDNFIQQRYSFDPLQVTFTAPTFFQTAIVLQNGVLSSSALLPDGLSILPWNLAEKILQPYQSKIEQHAQAFHALNMLGMQNPLLIHVRKSVENIPIVLSHYVDKAGVASSPRYVVLIEPGASALIVEHYQGTDVSYLGNTRTDLILKEKAQCTHYVIQEEGASAYHFHSLIGHLEQQAVLHSHTVSLGAAWSRNDVSVYFEHENAQAYLNGIYTPMQGQYMAQHTALYHNAGQCHSEQNYKGLVAGQAAFQGKIYVAPEAQGTEAHQYNKNLLCHPKAEVNTKPQLEIFADDVQCSHGATVGQIDDDMLFYMQSRGLSAEEALHFLMQAFIGENINLMPQESVRQWVMQQCLQRVSLERGKI
ncbi:MAG: Fe-S cluster assembly protein SufD [Legionellaceae bacterium]|nr:Fe-S cluster assembly protein SufD [Legionellaceae bacterium]